MPELPEVETLVRQLDKVLVGKVFEKVEILREKSAQSDLGVLEGKEIVGVRRLAKMIIIEYRIQNTEYSKQPNIAGVIPVKARSSLTSLDGRQVRDPEIANVIYGDESPAYEYFGEVKGDSLRQNASRQFLVVHLKMTGQLVYQENHEYRIKNIEYSKENNQASNFNNQTKSSNIPAFAKTTDGQGKINKHSKNIQLHEVEGAITPPSLQASAGQGNVARRGMFSQQTEYSGALRVVGGHPTGDWVGELPSKHTRIVATFTDGTKLFFNDQRVFGWWKIFSIEDLKTKSTSLPPDVVDRKFSFDYLKSVVKRSNRAIKLVILDQQKMGGMGNIYANDALWLAKINPMRKANSLNDAEIRELHQDMINVLNKGIETGGASYSHYVHADGVGGKYQEHFLVYSKDGKKCGRNDDGVIQKIKVGGRGTYYCEKCQK